MNYDQKFALYNQFYNHHLIEFVPEESKVLDIGCSGGQLGNILKNEKRCLVYGIDISAEAIIVARRFLALAEVVDIEKSDLPFLNEQFDIIIFGDVLEHLRDPEGALKKFVTLLAPGGHFIVSLPNVANISIRLKLLFGNWNYRPSGILDETHLRFYTYKTMKRLFDSCNLIIDKVESTPGFDFLISRYLPLVKPITDFICKLYPRLFANQFIFLLSPNER